MPTIDEQITALQKQINALQKQKEQEAIEAFKFKPGDVTIEEGNEPCLILDVRPDDVYFVALKGATYHNEMADFEDDTLLGRVNSKTLNAIKQALEVQ